MTQKNGSICNLNCNCYHVKLPFLCRFHVWLHDNIGWYRAWHHHSARPGIHILVLAIWLVIATVTIYSNLTRVSAVSSYVPESTTNIVVLDVVVPDAWDNGSFVADIEKQAGSSDYWQGEALNLIPALGTTDGVGYKDAGAAGFQGGDTEAVVIDLDADSVYTSAADTLVDSDGTDSTGPYVTSLSAGATLKSVISNISGTKEMCTNSIITPTSVRLKVNCTGGGGDLLLNLTGDTNPNAQAAATTIVGSEWAWHDSDGNNQYDNGEDIFIENVVGELTYSATADTDVYSTGGLSAGDALTNFAADCDGAGSGTQSCKYTGNPLIEDDESILIDEGTAAGAAPNGFVDKKADMLTGLGVRNSGTAENDTDIDTVNLWADDGDDVFESTEDDLLGTMTVNSVNTTEWRISGLSLPIPALGQRIYVTVDLTATPTDGRTLNFQVPAYSNAGTPKIADADGDVGYFVSSDNTSPSSPITSPDTFTIDSAISTDPSSLIAESNTVSSQDLSWDEASDPNFDHYEIWYGTSQDDVQNRNEGFGASKWDDNNDGALATAGTTSTTINGLDEATDYYYKIWAIDTFGHEATTPDTSATTATSETPECSDSIDNDDDGLTDLDDPGCDDGDDDDESDGTSECQDTFDNDDDGVADYPDDFSCESAIDNDETDPQAACQDGFDNDDDTFVDYEGGDPGCSSNQDDDETDIISPQCSDGFDNDDDTLTDYPDDPGCDNEDDDDETNVENTAPTVTIPTDLEQATNGSGFVTFKTTISDADSDESKIRVKYSTDGGSTWQRAYIDSATQTCGEDTNFGAVTLRNDLNFQIRRIDTDDCEDPITLTIVWNTKSVEEPQEESNLDNQFFEDVRVRVRAKDDQNNLGDPEETTGAPVFALDNKAPELLSFDSTTADDTYGPDSLINIRANYDESIDGESASLGVELNNSVSVILNSVSSFAISKNYTVGILGSGQDVTGLAVGSIVFESIKDLFGNEQSGSALPGSNFTSNSINVDTTTPPPPPPPEPTPEPSGSVVPVFILQQISEQQRQQQQQVQGQIISTSITALPTLPPLAPQKLQFGNPNPTDQVRIMQQMLNILYPNSFPKKAITGIYDGNYTIRTLSRFLQEVRLCSPTYKGCGYNVGQKTMKALFEAVIKKIGQ